MRRYISPAGLGVVSIFSGYGVITGDATSADRVSRSVMSTAAAIRRRSSRTGRN